MMIYGFDQELLDLDSSFDKADTRLRRSQTLNPFIQPEEARGVVVQPFAAHRLVDRQGFDLAERE
ncbi:hypothetical protein, partial [Mesorhizobium sp.]|uniref:hypothetical protein n=1 Tax=Mesorhizobium sp. TaxID=1871066 RepID=UPI000FE8BF69